MTDALIAFLRARFDDEGRLALGDDLTPLNRRAAATQRWASRADSSRDHMLAEVASKRRIVSSCESMLHSDTQILAAYARDIIEALLIPYAGHPDFDAAWAVDTPQ